MNTAPGSKETEAQQLEAEILRAHAAEDHRRLSALYEQAAGLVARKSGAETNLPGNRISDAEAFYLVQAYVFALNAGDERAAELKTRLINAGRES